MNANLESLTQQTTISVTHAGKILGLGRTAAYQAAKRGEIPTIRLGRRVVVSAPALLKLLQADDVQAFGGVGK